MISAQHRPTSFLRLGTWNVSGALGLEKRMMIDHIATHRQLDILCIQESHLHAQETTSTHFDWLLGPLPLLQNRPSRGCGFLVRKRFPYPVQFKSYSSNICRLTVSLSASRRLNILCIHKLSEGDPRSSLETGRILSITRALLLQGEVILCGDMNSHFGQDLLGEIDSGLLGPFLYHAISNSNGRDLYAVCEQLNLRIETTRRHPSTRSTWYRSTGRSQIDHVMIPISSEHILTELRGRWAACSDHKIITFNLQFLSSGNDQIKSDKIKLHNLHIYTWEYL